MHGTRTEAPPRGTPAGSVSGEEGRRPHCGNPRACTLQYVSKTGMIKSRHPTSRSGEARINTGTQKWQPATVNKFPQFYLGILSTLSKAIRLNDQRPEQVGLLFKHAEFTRYAPTPALSHRPICKGKTPRSAPRDRSAKGKPRDLRLHKLICSQW